MSAEQANVLRNRDAKRDPNQVEWKSGFYQFRQADKNERICDEHILVSVLYIYPFKGHSDGVPTDNTEGTVVRIGVQNSGPLVLPDVLNVGDTPFKFTAAVGKDGTAKHIDVHDIFGRCNLAGDGIYWIGHE